MRTTVARVIALLASCAAALDAAGQGAAAVPPPASGGAWVAGTFAGAAGTRRYALFVPDDTVAPRRAMVVLLHGCTQDAADLARGTRIAEHAARAGLLALLPEQPDGANPKKCWNWFDPAHQRRDAGEPALLHAMTQQVARERGVDPARIYLAGISAGAAMASVLAVAYPERWAALALHSGLAWRAADGAMAALGVMARGTGDAEARGAEAHAAMGARARAIPTLVIHGADDRVVHPANGREAARQWAVTNARAAGTTAAGTTSLATREERGEEGGYAWTRTCHGDAAGRCLVQEVVVQGLGHAWSGGSREGSFTDERGPDATAWMLRFFRDHAAPTR